MSQVEPEDLLLDFALAELLGAPANGDAADAEEQMVAQVMSAWESGERRPAPHRIHLSSNAPRRRLPHFNGAERPFPDTSLGDAQREMARKARGPRPLAQASSPRAAQWLAAAALVLAVGGAWWWAQRPGGAPEDPSGKPGHGPTGGPPSVQVAAAGWVPSEGASLRSSVGPVDVGASRLAGLQGAVVVAPGEPARMERRRGTSVAATLRAAPGSVVAFPTDASVGVAAGDVQLDVGAAPLSVELPGGVRFAAAADSSVQISALSGSLGRFVPNPDERLAAAQGDWQGIVQLTADVGELRLRDGAMLPLSDAGGATTLVISKGKVRVATVDDLGLATEVGVFLEDAQREKANELISASFDGGLLAALRREPELWPLAAPGFDQLFGDRSVSSYMRQGLIGSLAVDSSPVAHRVLRTAWRTAPEDFTTPAIVSLAESGVPEFEREVQAWLDFDGADPFAVAMYLALRGDDRGGAILREIVEADDVGAAPILAGAGLALLGDVLAWEKAVFDHVEGMRAALDADLIDPAAGMLNVLTYAVHIRRSADPAELGLADAPGKVMPVGMMQYWVGLLAGQRAESLVDVASIEAALARLDLP